MHRHERKQPVAGPHHGIRDQCRDRGIGRGQRDGRLLHRQHVYIAVQRRQQVAIDSINRGLLLQDVAPRSKLTRDIEALAPLVAGQQTRAESRRPGFLRGLLSR